MGRHATSNLYLTKQEMSLSNVIFDLSKNLIAALHDFNKMTSECDVTSSKLTIKDRPSLQCFFLFTHHVLGFIYLLRSLLKRVLKVQSILTAYSAVFGDVTFLSYGYCQSIRSVLHQRPYCPIIDMYQLVRNHIGTETTSFLCWKPWTAWQLIKRQSSRVCNARYALDGGHFLIQGDF
jgi:hypothetical protein